MSETIERVLCNKKEVFVYKIPPRTSNRGYRAADWNLSNPDWTGRLKVTTLNNELFIKLEDKTSGELFAKCPVDKFPGSAIESVTDSSRYFVIRIKDDNNRAAFIGIGFDDRGDSFDLNVTIQDFFKGIRHEEEIKQQEQNPESIPKLDLAFKEGQTIKINIGNKKGDSKKSRPQGQVQLGASGVLLPPPGAGLPQAQPLAGAAKPPPQNNEVNLLFDDVSQQPSSQQKHSEPPKADPWQDFLSASSTNQPKSTTQQNANAKWVQF